MKEPSQAHWATPDETRILVGGSVAWNGLAQTPQQTWAFRRAELTCFSESPFFCSNGQRVTMGHIRMLPPRAQGGARLVSMVERLFKELRLFTDKLPRGAKVAVVICLAERYAEKVATPRMRAQRELLTRSVEKALAETGLTTTLSFQTRGHAALAHAMVEVVPLLASRRVDAALVGGLDTSYDAEVIEALLEENRLFDGENLDSIIPGEGGAFSLLATAEVLRRAGLEPTARIEGVATAVEPAPQTTDLPTQAVGRTFVMRVLADQMAAARRKVDHWLLDLNNERYRMEEWQQAFPRATAQVSTEGTRFELLPALLGDLGAATLPTALIVAAEGLSRGQSGFESCIASASSVGPDRGAILLSRATATGNGAAARGS